MKFLLDHDVPAEVAYLLQYWGQWGAKVEQASLPVLLRADEDGERAVLRTASVDAGSPLDLLTGPNYGQIMLISATEFKATCLELVDRVQQTGEGITMTKHGKPLAKLAPIEPVHKAPGELFGCAKARVTNLGDIVAPVEALIESSREEICRPTP